jgi:hypothetical protein
MNMNEKNKTLVATWIGIISTVVLLIGAYSSPNRSLRLFLGIMGGFMPLPTLVASRRLDTLEDEATDHLVDRQIQRQLNPFKSSDQRSQVEQTQSLPLFDWKGFMEKRDQYPFAIFLGVQGAGKSTLASYLMGLGNARQILINKHVNFDLFPHAHHQVDPGTDFDRIFISGDEEKTLRLSALCSEKIIHCSFYQMILSFIAEFQYRFSTRQTNLEPFDLWIDEVPSLYSDFAENEETKALWVKFLKISMMEARKYKLRVFLIVQSKTVDSIGMKGLAALRDESVSVFLGDSAISQGKALKLDDEVMATLKTPYKACVINDEPFLLPDVKQANTEALQRRIKELEELVSQEVDEPEDGTIGYSNKSATLSIREIDSQDLNKLRSIRKAHPEWSMSRCIKNEMGLTGRNFGYGKQLWEELEGERS